MASLFDKTKQVFVRAYTRIRFGKQENVCQHYRSFPNQLSFDF